MRRLVVSLAAAAFASGCASLQSDPSRDQAEAVLPNLAAAFSACDMRSLMSLYSPGVEFISPSIPQPIVGKAALQSHLEGACTGAVLPVMKIQEQRVRSLAPGSMLVTGTYSIGRSDRPTERPWSAYFVATLSRVAGQWLVVSQATVPPTSGQ